MTFYLRLRLTAAVLLGATACSAEPAYVAVATVKSFELSTP